jgi:hypothetical protein
MLRRSSSATSATAASVTTAERMAEAAAAAARGDYDAALDGCSAEQRREAERRASLPLGFEEGAP